MNNKQTESSLIPATGPLELPQPELFQAQSSTVCKSSCGMSHMESGSKHGSLIRLHMMLMSHSNVCFLNSDCGSEGSVCLHQELLTSLLLQYGNFPLKAVF